MKTKRTVLNFEEASGLCVNTQPRLSVWLAPFPIWLCSCLKHLVYKPWLFKRKQLRTRPECGAHS